MRLGVMIGAERGDMARKVAKLLDDIAVGREARARHRVDAAGAQRLRRLTMVALMGAHTSRIELGTAVVPLQAQHPVALARQALSAHAMTGGRLALGVGPSHHWIIRDMLGLPYEKPAAYTRDYLEVLDAALRGRGPATVRIDVENDTFTVHNPIVLGAGRPMPVLVAALGPVMLQIAGERADGTVLWMADERAIGDHIVPKITKAAAERWAPGAAHRGRASRSACARPPRSRPPRSGPTGSSAEAETSPNYQRLLDRGDARDVGDLCAAGDEDAILARFSRFADAGVTDLSVRLLPDRRDPRRVGRVQVPDPEVIAELVAKCDEPHRSRGASQPSAAMSARGPAGGYPHPRGRLMLAGPYATMLLADLGAEVIKIEPPGGEISRQVGDSYFASLNRNKQSVCLDLASEAGRQRLGELVADSHALLVNMKPSAIRRLGLTYEALRQCNERIVCVALTGFGLDGGDDPAFDYVIQAATGVAAMTGDPDGPPTLPGYSSADNSTGLTAALGLLAQIVSGRGGQVDVSLRDVMLSQLNYRASAYLNDGAEPQRHPFGAHSYYVPAQLFPTADGLSGAVHHPRRVLEVLRGRGGHRRLRRRWPNALRSATRCSQSSPRRWPATPLGVGSRGCVRWAFPPPRSERCPRRWRRHPRPLVRAGDFRLVGSAVRIVGYEPDYRPPPLSTSTQANR